MMKGALVLAIIGSVAALSVAAPIQSEWLRGVRAAATDVVRLHVAVKNEALDDVLAKKFFEVSDPRNPNYGDFWTHEEMARALKPDDSIMTMVKAYFTSQGASDVSVVGSGDMLRVHITVDRVEAVLGESLFYYSHPHFEGRIVRSDSGEYRVPQALADLVDFISGVAGFPEVRRNILQKDVAASTSVTPNVIRKLYGIDETAGSSNSSQGLAEFQHQSFSKLDLKEFESLYDVPKQEVRNIYGPDSGLGHTEANLDVQYVIATGQGVATDFYIEKGYSFDLVAWASEVLSKPGMPLVWSVSYGEDLSAVTADYAQRLDGEFRKMAVMGVSVLFASGDSGVYSRSGGYDTFHPSYPACLPSVTAVGATQLNSDGTETKSTPWSGGGFSLSSYFTRNASAPWQVNAVEGYFKEQGSKLPPSSHYNADGVGFPDVSALGLNFKVVLDFIPVSVSGTSASCPTFAGVVGLVNDKRMAAGKGPLGFLNPFLFQNADAFKDITEGNNANGMQYGFNAAPGWDPVTGLGTVKYAAFKQAAMAA